MRNKDWSYSIEPARTVAVRARKAHRERRPEQIVISTERGVFVLVGAGEEIAQEIVADHNITRRMVRDTTPDELDRASDQAGDVLDPGPGR